MYLLICSFILATVPEAMSQTTESEGPRGKRLSAREKEILTLAADGCLDKEIGARLGLSLNTLRTYWSRIRAKLDNLPRAALVSQFIHGTSNEEGAAPSANPVWDFEIDLPKRVYRRLSRPSSDTRFMPGEDILYDEILERIHPEDRRKSELLLEGKVAPEVGEFHAMVRTIWPTGLVTGNTLQRVVRDENGVPVKILGRLLAAGDLRSPYVVPVPKGTWSINLITHQFSLSPECGEMLELDPSAPQLYEEFLSRFHKKAVDDAKRFVSQAIMSGKPLVFRFFRLHLPNGTEPWLATELTITFDDATPVRADATVQLV